MTEPQVYGITFPEVTEADLFDKLHGAINLAAFNIAHYSLNSDGWKLTFELTPGDSGGSTGLRLGELSVRLTPTESS